MILPAHYDDFEPVIIGYSWDTSFIYKIGDEPVDFTGYSMEMRIFDSFEDDVPIITLSSERNEIELSENGEVLIKMTPEQTATIPQGGKFYIVDMMFPGGTPKYQILVGRLRVIDRG
jgi:hypothetical protein